MPKNYNVIWLDLEVINGIHQIFFLFLGLFLVFISLGHFSSSFKPTEDIESPRFLKLLL